MLILKILFVVYTLLKWYSIVGVFNYVDAINVNVDTIPDINKHAVIRIDSSNNNNVAIGEQQQQQHQKTSDDSFSVYNFHQHENDGLVVVKSAMLQQPSQIQVPLESRKTLKIMPHNVPQSVTTSPPSMIAINGNDTLDGEDQINAFELSKLRASEIVNNFHWTLFSKTANESMDTNQVSQTLRKRRRKKRAENVQNVCHIEECNCTLTAHFPSVNCDFSKQYRVSFHIYIIENLLF